MQLLELAIYSALIVFAVYLALAVLAAVAGMLALVGNALAWVVALGLVLLCACVDPTRGHHRDEPEDDPDDEQGVSGSCRGRYTPQPRCLPAVEPRFARIIDTGKIATIKWEPK